MEVVVLFWLAEVVVLLLSPDDLTAELEVLLELLPVERTVVPDCLVVLLDDLTAEPDCLEELLDDRTAEPDCLDELLDDRTADPDCLEELPEILDAELLELLLVVRRVWELDEEPVDRVVCWEDEPVEVRLVFWAPL